MEYFSSISEYDIVSIIAQLISLSSLILSLKYWRYANQSHFWPTVKGVVSRGMEFGMSSDTFLYEYEVKGKEYQRKKPFFSTSSKFIVSNKDRIEKYSQGNVVVVYYNPINPKISTLVPGKKQGIVNVFILMLLIFLVTFLSFFFPDFFNDTVSIFFSFLN
ncbi:uncharacterized protein DUF3592 [Mariniflexile fucanivorans]|uniref:Uncharacterized protein DUF3592 n=1 Tax=Mariniflexile fucanivorans TaxID=264023 RepID=A0A4R1RQM1_9FLAO|nr:DUF3592 domain-containing protein [Mariniflexile fucanivorans]TCL68713.1 uncharacterized protein DUF3592 [Mariniflexile fucanivorans]